MRLVVLAAGLGTRFGGPKQLTPVGPGGEIILDYAVRDGAAAGFDEVVVVTRSELAPALAGRHPGLEVVCQDGDPLGRRPKPLGTAHAALCGMRAGGEATRAAVVNGDDVYPADAYRLLATYLAQECGAGGAMVTFPVSRTLLSDGPVSRALCTVEEGVLRSIEEGTVDGGTWVGTTGRRVVLDGTEPVSMNCWALEAPVAAELEAACRGVPAGAEALLPDVVRGLVGRGGRFVALASEGRCVGVTHPGDVAVVRRALAP